MNRSSRLLQLANKLDNKGLVKEADSIERLVKLSFGPEQQLSLFEDYRAMPQSWWRSYNDAQKLALQEGKGRNYQNMIEKARLTQRLSPPKQYDLFSKGYGDQAKKIRSVVDSIRNPVLPGGPRELAERATESAAHRTEGEVSDVVRNLAKKPSNLKILGKLGLLGAGAYGIYKGGQWLGNQLRSDWGPQPQGPQPPEAQPIYPGAYAPPTGMTHPSQLSETEIDRRLQTIYDQQVPPPSYNPPEWGQMVPASRSYV